MEPRKGTESATTRPFAGFAPRCGKVAVASLSRPTNGCTTTFRAVVPGS